MVATYGRADAPARSIERGPESQVDTRPDEFAAPTPTSRDRRLRSAYAVLVVSVLVLAGVVRLVPMWASLPYPGYVDEGHTLVHGADLLDRAAVDPEWYDYPTLPIAVSAGVIAVAGLPTAEPKRSRDISWTATSGVYEDIRPTSRALLGNRLVTVTFSVATVAVVMLIGARLARRRVALAAGVLAALVPALVTRGGFDLVDTMVTFFVAAAFLVGLVAVDARRRRTALIWTTVAGACCGLAAGSKYPGAAAVAMVVVLVVGCRPGSLAARGARGAVAVAAAALVFVATMPAVITNRDAVRAGVTRNYDRYAAKELAEQYWSSAPKATEVGVALLVLALIGVVLLLRWHRTRLPTVAWLLYAVLLVGVAARLPFQPFRNVISIIPFLCVAAAVGLDGVARAVGRWQPSLPRWVADATVAVGTAAVALALFLGGVSPFYRNSLVPDPRVEAREWLEANVEAGDTVTLMAELVFAKHELDLLPGTVTVVSAVDGSVVRAPTDGGAPDGEHFLVTGTLEGRTLPWVPEDGLQEVAEFGRRPVPEALNLRRTDARVLVLRSG